MRRSSGAAKQRPSAAPSFDRIARLYRWAEYITLGPLLTRTRNHYLPRVAAYMPARRRALVLGDGDGRFLAALLQQSTDLHALAVDTSASMLRLLRERCLRTAPRAGMFQLRTMQATALEVTASRDTDLIVTHFFLDCLTQAELDALALKLTAATRPGTLWLVSDFALPESRILRPLAAIYIRGLYLAFRVLTGLRVTKLPDTESSLTAAGFERLDRHERLGGLLYSEIWRRK